MHCLPQESACGDRLQHCSLCPFSAFSPLSYHKSASASPLPLCAQLSREPLSPLELCPLPPLRGIFSLNRLIDIAGGRWTDTQTPFPGNQPENPQVDSHTTIPNPCRSCQPECSPVSKALGSLCLRYDVLGSKPSLINFKKPKKTPTLVFYKSESLGQRGGEGGFR